MPYLHRYGQTNRYDYGYACWCSWKFCKNRIRWLKECSSMVYNVINISSLTTDRHKDPFWEKTGKIFDISLTFGILLITSAKKKAAKKRCYSELGAWIKGIKNHFWCCTTCKGDVKLLTEKWICILYHIKNVHEWEDHSLFKECAHREYTLHEMKLKAWLKESSFGYAALKKLF